MSLLCSFFLRHRRWLFVAVAAVLAAQALWNMGNTLFFVHRAQKIFATVVDWRLQQRKGLLETWQSGKSPFSESPSYFPIVDLQLPCGIPTRMQLTDSTEEELRKGRQLSVLALENDPTTARLYSAEALFLPDIILLAESALCALLAYFSPCRKKKAEIRPKATPSRHAKKTPRDTPSVAPIDVSEPTTKKNAPSRRKRETSPRKKRQAKEPNHEKKATASRVL